MRSRGGYVAKLGVAEGGHAIGDSRNLLAWIPVDDVKQVSHTFPIVEGSDGAHPLATSRVTAHQWGRSRCHRTFRKR